MARVLRRILVNTIDSTQNSSHNLLLLLLLTGSPSIHSCILRSIVHFLLPQLLGSPSSVILLLSSPLLSIHPYPTFILAQPSWNCKGHLTSILGYYRINSTLKTGRGGRLRLQDSRIQNPIEHQIDRLIRD